MLCIRIIISLFAFLLCAHANAQYAVDPIPQKLCVINFDNPLSENTLKIEENLPQNEFVHFYRNGRPSDLLDCFLNQEVVEIVLIAHSTPLKEGRGINFYLPSSDQFEPYPIPKIFFKNLSDQVIRSGTKVKSLRVMACDFDEILESYPEINELIKKFKINLDLAPTFALIEPLTTRKLTMFDLEWLKESFQSMHDDSQDVRVFIGLGNVLLVQAGSRKALRGQYLIGVNGLSFGVSYYYTFLSLPKAYFEDLEVGKRRKIKSDSIQPAGVIASHFKSFVFENDEVIEKDLSNNFGLSLRLTMEVNITRLY